MKKQSILVNSAAILLAVSVLFAGCSSSTMIQSTPVKGAKVYMNGEYVGKTPYLYTDTKIVGSSTDIKLEKEGYQPLYATLTRNEEVEAGAIVGGIFVLVPFLWTMKYKAVHNYELIPLNTTQSEQSIQEEQPAQTQVQNTQKQTIVKSKAEKLRELKELLDGKLITKDDYEKEKQKILNQQ